MKKIFYILVSAIVALGAVACNNEIDENIEANRSEGVSFTASLDETASRILVGDLNESGKHPITFESDDVIYATYFGEGGIVAPFAFTTTDGVTFTCLENNADGLAPQTLIGQSVEFSVNEFDSSKGVDGIVLYASQSFENNSTVTLGLRYGVFAFTSSYEVTLTASEGIFSWKIDEDDYQTDTEITIPAAEGIQYVPFIPQNEAITLSYSINDEKVKEITREFSNKIYTLGGLNEAVASVNGVNYTDLNQAVAAAVAAGQDVVLAADATVTEPILVPEGAEVTIDLNGMDLTADNTTYAINNLGTLTLKDSNAGAIPSSSSVMAKTSAEIDWSVSARGIYNGYDKDGNYVTTAKLIIESGNYQATGTNGGAAVFNYGILEVKGGYFQSNGGYGLNNQTADATMTVENAKVEGGIYNKGTLTVKDTELLQHLSGKHAIYNWAGSVTIDGGEFDSLSGNELILADGENATVIINNGTFKKTAKSWLFGAATGKNISFVINDGTFYGYVNEPEMTVDTIRPYGDPIVVKGGSFNFDPTQWLAEGLAAVDNGNGTYTVVKQAYVINQAGEYEISSKEGLMWLADAVNSGNEEIAGKTIVLTSNIDLEGENWTPIGFNENGIVESTDKYFTGTFDGKGHTIYNLNIENDNAGGVGLFGAVHDATFKNFTLEDVNIKAVDADATSDISGAQGQANYIVGGHIGAVAAYDAKAGTVTFDNVHLKGLIKIEGETRYAQGQRIAGVFGGKSSSKVVFNKVSVKGDDGSYIKGYCSTAGVVGQHMGVGTFTDVHTDIDVYGVTFGVGGIAGITLEDSTFDNCSSAGDLTLDARAVQPASYSGNYFFRIGGIAGCWSESANAELTLTNCSYTGTFKSFNKEGNSPFAFDYDGYVGRGFALNGCAGSTVIIDGKEFVQVTGNIHGFYMVDGVYEIMNEASLTWFANEVNANGNNFSGKTVALIDDVTLTEAWEPVGQTGATQFHGTFDGQNKTIKGLTINASESYSGNYATGLFGWVETGAVIKNIVLDGAAINGYHYVGAIAGYTSGSAKIEGCEVKNSAIVADPTKKDTAGEFNGDKVGGIVGYTNGNNVINGNKVSKTTIKGYRHMGGIVGYLYGTAEGNSIENVTITVDNSNNYKGYDIQSKYGVNSIAGVMSGTSTNNTGEATIEWGEIPAAFKVVNNAGWDKVYLYAWQGENKILGEWPGVEISNGYAAIPAEYVGETVNYVIHNNNGIQTADLKVDKFEDNFTDTIGDPKPETITIYLNNNWSVENLKLYTWEPALWGDTAWATGQKEPTGTVTTDWGTFTYWDVPADAIATDKVGNLLVTGTGKQTADLTNVDYSKDVYLEFNWTSEKGDHLVVKTTPY